MVTALIKSFCRGVQGGQFFQKAPPLAAGGKGKSNGKRIKHNEASGAHYSQ